jgi:CheY-like chemotaxis protein
MNALLDYPIRDFATMHSHRPGLGSILYVDDDEAIRRLSTQTLTRCGYGVTAAKDGFEALEALHAEDFDLLITDNELPRLTGLELISRARLEGIELPIIIASGSAGAFAGTECQRLHLAAALQKPFTMDELVATVQQVFSPVAGAECRSRLFSRTLAEALSRIQPAQHWGINE